MESAPRLAAALLVPVAVALAVVAALGDATAAHLAHAGGIGVVAAIVAGRLLARAAHRPLHALRTHLEAVGRGESPPSLPPSSGEAAEIAACAARLCRTHEEREATLQRERDALAQVLDRMAEGVMVVARDGRVARTNPAIERLVPRLADESQPTPGEATGSHEVQLACSRAITTGQVQEARLTTDGGRTLLVTAAPAGGGAVVVFHDITEMHRALEVRRDFVANASHELKTPVAAILGGAETLANGGLADPVAAARFTDTIHRHAKRLARLIDDLLALSRLEAGTTVERRPVALAEVVAEVCDLMEEPFRTAGVALTWHADPDLPPWRGDRRSVEEILTNLLDNARAYTPKGGEVEVRVTRTADGLALAVGDTGIGIGADHLDRIFERFYRVDPARSRAAGGTGLGLALVKHLVESLGGRIEVASEVGVGSTFTVELPGDEGWGVGGGGRTALRAERM